MITEMFSLSGIYSKPRLFDGGLVSWLISGSRSGAAPVAANSPHLQHDRGESDCRPAPEGPHRPLAFTASFEAMKLRSF